MCFNSSENSDDIQCNKDLLVDVIQIDDMIKASKGIDIRYQEEPAMSFVFNLAGG